MLITYTFANFHKKGFIMKKRLTLIQVDTHVKDVEYNYNHIEEQLHKALDEKPDIIVLPETWNTGFYPSTELINYADHNGDRTRHLLSNFAKKHSVNIVGGSVAVAQNNQVFNTSYIYNRTGDLVGEYSKIHGFSPAKEEQYFTGGTEITHFTLDDIPCSMVICYDIRFPELVRMAALPNSQLLFVPAQWPTMRLRHWQVLNEVRAIENQLFVCAVNGCGTIGRAPIAGHSVVYDPWGTNLLEMGDIEEIRTVEIDLDIVSDIRNKINIFKDRRPELYKL